MNRPYVPSDGTSSERSSSPSTCLRFLFPPWRFPRGLVAAGVDATRTDIGSTSVFSPRAIAVFRAFPLATNLIPRRLAPALSRMIMGQPFHVQSAFPGRTNYLPLLPKDFFPLLSPAPRPLLQQLKGKKVKPQCVPVTRMRQRIKW